MAEKNTLIVGASTNPERYAYMAAEMLAEKEIKSLGYGLKTGQVAQTVISNSWDEAIGFKPHTITLYLGSSRQKELEKKILDLKPKRIIFNPGAENPSFKLAAEKAGIECHDACTLVMLRTGLY